VGAGCLLLLAQQGVCRHMLQRPPQPPHRLKTYHTLWIGIGLQVSNSNTQQGQLQFSTGWLAAGSHLSCSLASQTVSAVQQLPTRQCWRRCK
jgi:hypothetical protein